MGIDSGVFVCVVGPSGSGKSTLISQFLEKYRFVVFGRSATTRAKRECEDNSKYLFLTQEEFKKSICDGKFLEYARVHNKDYYGLLKENVLTPIKNSEIVIKDVDYQGLYSVKKIIPENELISIFVLPDLNSLKNRIMKRQSIEYEELERRMKSINLELGVKDVCSCVVKSVEGNFEKSFENFENAIKTELKQRQKENLLYKE